MKPLVSGLQTIDNHDDLVVFLIGAQVHKWWLLPLALPIVTKMQRMLEELAADPESGLLGVQPLGFGGSVQYWRSVDDLVRYASSREHTHRPTAKRYFQKVFRNEAVGVWHEVFVVKAGHYEALYSNMPAFGMGRFLPMLPATGELATTRGRLRTGDDEPESASPVSRAS